MLLLFINVHLIEIHLIPHIIIVTNIITSMFLLFLYQLEEHVTYLVCEVKGRRQNSQAAATIFSSQLQPIYIGNAIHNS